MRKGPLFMHTIEGKPATFSKRDGQIVFADLLPHWQDRPTRVTLRGSVKQIERDQATTLRNRKRWKMATLLEAHRYGYVIVRRPR